MECTAEAERAMIALLSRWLAEAEVHSWLRACAQFAASGAEPAAPPDPWPAVRTAVEQVLEAKSLVERYHAHDQEGPDPFAADLAALLRVLPARRGGAGSTRAGLLLQIHTQELLERCQRRPRPRGADPDPLLPPLLGAAEGIPRRRRG